MRARYLLLSLMALALIAPTCGGKDLGTEPAGQKIGNIGGYNAIEYPVGDRGAAPDWSGKDLRGAPITAASFKGSITVVNVWASWCAPCRVEQPALERVAQAYGSKGVRFVGVNIRDSNTDALAHVEEFGVTYPSVFNPDSTIAHKFRVSAPPTTFVLDAAGRIAWKILGETRESDLSRILDLELTR